MATPTLFSLSLLIVTSSQHMDLVSEDISRRKLTKGQPNKILKCLSSQCFCTSGKICFSTIPYLDIFFELLVHGSSRPDKITPWSQNTVQFQKELATFKKVIHPSLTMINAEVSFKNDRFRRNSCISENLLHAKGLYNVHNVQDQRPCWGMAAFENP